MKKKTKIIIGIIVLVILLRGVKKEEAILSHTQFTIFKTSYISASISFQEFISLANSWVNPITDYEYLELLKDKYLLNIDTFSQFITAANNWVVEPTIGVVLE